MTGRRDVAEEVTARIMACLERGTVPWHRPWAESGLPRSELVDLCEDCGRETYWDPGDLVRRHVDTDAVSCEAEGPEW